MLKQNPFQQGFDGSCGPASLKIALKHFGINKSEKALIRLTKCGEEGVELEDLLNVAKKFKINGFVKETCDIKDIKKYLKSEKYTIIVGWFDESEGHYSVVSRIDKENIYIQDPELGHIRAMRIEKFERIWFDFPGRYIKTKSDLQLRKMLVLHK
ncbi:MAG: cysteine peptidase family C39 domain-containing protein [archaeon]